MASELCLVCRRQGLIRCSGCRVAYYCTEDHQNSDWIMHQSNCSPYQMVWDDNMGHHLIASRDLEPGSFILHEAPLVTCLGFSGDYSTFCLGCSKQLEKGVSPVSCPQCSWPSMCGKEKCWKEGSPHTEGECSWFKAIRHKMSTKRLKKMNILVVQLSISVLRCIALKQQEPLKWEKMMKMELKYSDLISRCQHGPQFREAAVELVCKWIEKSNNNIPRDCVVKLCDMFHLLNTFRKEPTL